MDTGLLIGLVGIVVGIVGIVITMVIAVCSMRDARKQVKDLINLERNRVYVRIRNDMVWLFVDPTELAHSVEIAKGLEEFNLISTVLEPKQNPDITKDIVNNKALEFAQNLVESGYAIWKPEWDMERVKHTIAEWKQSPHRQAN